MYSMWSVISGMHSTQATKTAAAEGTVTTVVTTVHAHVCMRTAYTSQCTTDYT
jgi:hypothetical protein